MSAHTPGPWSLAPFNGDETDPLDVVSEYEEIGGGRVSANWIAEVHLETDDAENLANARLIAAAPDLLEALSAVMDAYTKRETIPAGWALQARRAIAKAKGR